MKQVIMLSLLTATASLAAEVPPPPQMFNFRKGSAQPLEYTGVNLAGGEFGNSEPGKARAYASAYIYPSAKELEYFASKGCNIIRFPFRWPDLQPALKQPLVQAVLERIKNGVAEANQRGQIVLLDPHDYARYYGKIIGSPAVPIDAFADFWTRLSEPFKNNPRVWFGLMNEPHDMPTEQWLDAANAAIASIRSTGATNKILVPGNSWTGAHSWVASGNAQVMLKIVDPQNNYFFEVHQYLDSDCSGTKPEAVSLTIGSERLKQFTEWCRAHHQRALLGEFGSANNQKAALATEDMLNYMEKNRDVWAGFTWWSAGAWWGDYMFSIEPGKDGKDRPQMSILRPHLQQGFYTPDSEKSRMR